MKAEASAPSNIALIKYMGKTADGGNLPANASLSYTLEHLRSFVTIEAGAPRDNWQPLPDLPVLDLSPAGQMKFLSHFQRLKYKWRIPGHFIVRSSNNFPADCGLASSASSFAALTMAAWNLALALGCDTREDAASLSRLSRLGSGSSCRSFFSPWAVWRGEGAEPVMDLDLRLEHAVVIAAATKKTVSSSEAHARVPTSLLFQGRAGRAETRLHELQSSLKSGEWKIAAELCWNEFWDMHALFATSRPAFNYLNAESLNILERANEMWRETGDGPLVTMDAGANVHLLLRAETTRNIDQKFAGMNLIRSWN